MKEGVNLTCSVFVGGVILASWVGSIHLPCTSYAVQAHHIFTDRAGQIDLVQILESVHKHSISKDLEQDRAGNSFHLTQKFLAPGFPRPAPS